MRVCRSVHLRHHGTSSREATDAPRLAGDRHRRVEDPNPDRRLEQQVKSKLFLLQIAHGPTAAPLDRRVAGRTALTGVQHRPLLVNRINALGEGRLSAAEAIDIRRQIAGDQHGDRRRPQRPMRQDVPGTVRVRCQPALPARDELARDVLGGDQVAGNNVPWALGAARRRSQPRVARQGDARTGEPHQR